MKKFTAEDVSALAAAVYGEARGEKRIGQDAVAHMAWIVDDVSKVTGVTLNNMLKWGQPYKPYQSELFKSDLYDSGAGEPPTIHCHHEGCKSQTHHFQQHQ